jgi:CYTH domain-containing protein
MPFCNDTKQRDIKKEMYDILRKEYPNAVPKIKLKEMLNISLGTLNMVLVNMTYAYPIYETDCYNGNRHESSSIGLLSTGKENGNGE